MGHIRTGLWQCALMATYSAVPLRDQALCTMTWWYLTQSHYPDTGQTSPCPILIMLSARLGSDKYKFLSVIGLTRLWIKLPTFRMGSLCSTNSAAVSAEWVSGDEWQSHWVIDSDVVWTRNFLPRKPANALPDSAMPSCRRDWNYSQQVNIVLIVLHK